jgi:hypothetical protein
VILNVLALWYIEHEATVFVTACHFCPGLISAFTIRVWFVEYPSQTYAAQQIVKKFVTMSLMDFYHTQSCSQEETFVHQTFLESSTYFNLMLCYGYAI